MQSLADRKERKTKEQNLAVGDFVAEIKADKKNHDWSTGRVVRVYPGANGLVHAVDVHLGDGIYNRGSNQLCLVSPGSNEPPEPSLPSSGENVAAKTQEC